MRKRSKTTTLILLMLSVFAVSNVSADAQEKTFQQYMDASQNAKEADDLETADKLSDSATKLAKSEFQKYQALSLKGTIAYQRSHFKDAVTYFNQAKEALLAFPKPVHPTHLADLCEDIGRTYQKLADYAHAEEAFNTAINHLKKSKPVDNTRLGHLYFLKTQVTANESDALESVRLLKFGTGLADKEALISAKVQLGELKKEKGETREAEEIYKQAIEDRTKLLGTINHKNNAYMLTRLGTLCFEQDRLPEAEEHFKRALTIAETVRGPVHEQVAIIASKLASVYSDQQRYDEAEKYTQKALSIMEKLGSPETAEVAILQLNVDYYRAEMGLQTRPDAATQRSIEIVENHFGKSSEQAARAYARWANIYEDRDLAKARKLVAHALEIAEKNKYMSPTSILSKSARLAMRDSDYSAAKDFLERLLVAAKLDKLPRDEAEENYASLFGEYYQDTNQFEKAEKLYKSQIYSHRKKYGEGHPTVAIALNNLGMLYKSAGQYSDALKCLEQSLAIDKATYGINNPNTLVKMTNVASIYASAGDFKAAEPLAKVALAGELKIHPADHSDVKYAQDTLNSLYDSHKQLRASKPLIAAAPVVATTTRARDRDLDAQASMEFTTAHAAQKTTQSIKLNPASNPFGLHLPNYLRGMVETLLKANKAAEAKKIIDIHFNMLETKVGKTDTIIADHLMELSALMATHNQQTFAKQFLDKSYSIWMSIQPRLCAQGNVDFQITQMASREGGLNTLRLKAARNLIQAAQQRSRQGDSQTYAMCVKGAQKCLECADAPSDRVSRVKLCLELAKVTRLSTDFAYSRSAADLALKVAQQDTKSSNLKSDALLELARLTLAQRDYASCARFAGQCLELVSNAPSPNTTQSNGRSSSNEVEALTLLCTCSAELGKTEDAIKYGTKATSALENAGTFNQSVIDLIETLVDLHTKKKEYPQSIEIVDKGLKYCTSFNQTESITYADLLWSKARLKNVLQDEVESKKLRDEAGALYKAHQNSTDLVVAIHCNSQLAIWENKRGNEKAASDAALKAAEKVSEYVKVIFPQLSFGEQCAFLQNTVRPQIGYLILYCKDEAQQRRAAYSHLIQWKGLLISSLRKQTVVMNSSDKRNPEIAKLIEELEDVRNELAAWHLKMSDRSLTPEQWTSKNDELTVRKEAIERELSQHTKQAGYFDHAAAFTSAEFDKTLAENEIFLDFYRYVRPGFDLVTDESKSSVYKPRYAAYVVSHTFYPDFVFLGTSDEVDKAIKDWRSDVLDNVSDAESRKALDKLVWKEISNTAYSQNRRKYKQYVEPNRFFICPDAEIARVPWSTFLNQNPKGEPILTTVFDSPREFINSRLNRLLSAGDASRMMLVGNVDFSGTDTESLTATEKEVRDISEIAKKASIQTDILTQKDATKAAVLSKLHGESIVHLATHGYFASTQNLPTAWRESLGAVSLVRSSQAPLVTYATRNLLLSSGLLFAPPHLTSSVPTTVRHADRLSAEELIGLDLSKCNLITLSACETGRGEEVTGQGVMGLRSAMMAAGARSILMSLWKVPDDATQKLMTYFYTNLLIKKLPKAEALKLAQQSVRDDSSGKYKHPWFWAAWVLAGDGW